MKNEYAASAILKNDKGGKESDVKLYIALQMGEGHRHCWKIQGIISVTRNGYPFRVEKTSKNSNKKEFLMFLSSEICRQIEQHYSDGSKVDPETIIEFVYEEVNKFAQQIE